MVVKFVIIDDEQDWLEICTSLLKTTLTDMEMDIKTFQKSSEAYDYILKNQSQVIVIISGFSPIIQEHPRIKEFVATFLHRILGMKQ